MSVLYYCPVSVGGLADYAHEQANALSDAGVEVSILCAPAFSKGRLDQKYQVLSELVEERSDLLTVRRWRRQRC